MQFVVPQFIEVESKVIGPISVRQFIILLASAGLIFIWYSLFSTIPLVVLSIPTLGIGIIFAFAKVNGQPFHNFALSLVQTLQRPRLSLWKRQIHRQVVVKMARKDKHDKTKKEFESKHLFNSDFKAVHSFAFGAKVTTLKPKFNKSNTLAFPIPEVPPLIKTVFIQ